MQALVYPAQFNKAVRRADDSVAITIITAEEISTDEFAHMDQYRKNNGYFMFKSNKFDEKDIPSGDAEIKGQISPSKYLRNCLFAKHMALGGKKEEFPKYYNKVMAGFAQAVNESYEE